MAAGPFSENTLWVAEAAHFIMESREDVFVVFHKLSGDTHILNFLSAGIVEVLRTNGAANFNQIVERVLALLELDASDCPEQLVRETVLQLDDVGLVYPFFEDSQ